MRNRRLWPSFALFVITLTWTRLSPIQAQNGTPTPAFEDVSETAGLTAVRQGVNEKMTGQAWGDYDQDGWLDLYVTDTHGPNTLYYNNGDGTFSRSPLADSVALPDAFSGGVSFADYDNDGWPDLYVMNWGANTLFHNDQGTAFTDVTETAAVGDTRHGKTAAWGDYDQDGYLDLYLANWSCIPRCGRPNEGDRDSLYHNNGDGTFTDVTNALGSQTAGAGFVASFVDYDNDGDSDIYLVNDEFLNPIGNQLWRNDGPGCELWCFTNVSADSGTNAKVMGMGLATADYDADGDLDFYFSNVGPMILLQNQGDGTFINVATVAGVEFPVIGWGSVFFDYNNDGWTDLYLAAAEPMGDGGTAINPLFHNNGDGTFSHIGDRSGAGDPGRTIGVAYADYDRDGRVDLVIGNYDEGYRLYRNVNPDPHNWITLHLTGAGPVNRDAVGARVRVEDSNGRWQMQDVTNGTSIGAGSTLALHFGLGQTQVTQIDIRWPDGTTQTLPPLTLNQPHHITYGIPYTDPYQPPAAPEVPADSGDSQPGTLSLVQQSLIVVIILVALFLIYNVYLLWRLQQKKRP